jgi:NAD(P)-dependent dehydrogenase (short-subunit alcohol dehydrogenase family)
MRWTLVTGGAMHLGSAIVKTLAKEGRRCVIHYRNSKAQAEQVQNELLALGSLAEIIQGDFASIDSTRAFLQEYLSRFEETEILINNVGNYALGAPSEILPEEMCDLFQVNVNAPLMCIQALLPSLKKCKGHIVNIGTVGSTHNVANTYATAYNMTKLSLAMLTRSFAKELAPFQVSVNMVSPGYLETSVDLPKDLPWGCPATLDEVAEYVRTFTTSHYITGQNLEIAGGIRL